MKLTGIQTLPAPRQKVWEFLNDPQCLARCMPGCEKLETVGENEYSGVMNVGLAAVKGVYNGKVKLDEIQPSVHYKMMLDGKGKQGFIKGSGTIDLEEQNGQTLLKYSGDVQIGGLLASVGQRMIDGAAKMMIGQFFTAMEAEIKAMPGEEVRQGILINLWRSFFKFIREKFARLFGKKKQEVRGGRGNS
ncbi:MAG: carbon monoxide dehydrogenase subunit G [Deltaproteobacteria bacterium]|nr:carbon monoxide dehydrogenase subunit G [Deltaproteobacteria bacterium]